MFMVQYSSHMSKATHIATEIIHRAREQGFTVGTVESCTGGLVGGALTAVSGSSKVFQGGLITYSNNLKRQLAAVPSALLNAHGAVSTEVAEAMALGGRRALAVNVCVAVTGIAGPASDDTAKPVGLVYIACIGPDSRKYVREFQFSGDREAIRTQSVEHALTLLLEALS